jgi:hypothetical protein
MSASVIWPLPVDPSTYDALATGHHAALICPLVAFAVGDLVRLYPSDQAPTAVAAGRPAMPVARAAESPTTTARITGFDRAHPGLLPGWGLLHLTLRPPDENCPAG